ncbi:hypothetical protein ACHAW5_004244 [Stephanodiscus triporus]|uniref:Uncharacterized protein n=1 Tax=Stephanodiscus triporus TaxID=2934178 RepID=A0ABD3NM65_9STRA
MSPSLSLTTPPPLARSSSFVDDHGGPAIIGGLPSSPPGPDGLADDHRPSSVARRAQSFTRVDGKGLWRSWRRNFKDKLLAVLDLVDNSLDAALGSGADGEEDDDDDSSDDDFVGRVHIYPDDYVRPPGMSSSSSSAALLPDHAPSDATTLTAATTPAAAATTRPPPSGLCIVNNSRRPIRPLREVLEVYSSSKTTSGAKEIGENGVGLKQGCATLSDLSFVLAKNGTERFVELGIIAESLQMAEGCYLPAFRFAMPEDDDVIPSLRDRMIDLLSRTEHANVAKCIERYGSKGVAVFGGGGARDALGRGVDRLCGHFDGMLDFFDSRHVFAVVLDGVSYGKTNDRSRQALDAIRDLRSVIPRTYLHVPAGFDFRIGTSSMNRERAVFHYWPQRLVELSSFHVDVNENVPWHIASGINNMPTSYKLRVFVGFDRMRINSPEEGKAASLYVYSRHSGRLIKHEQDARHALGLSTSGSTFCSGLTVLVDDIDGKLPLNPTKQDVAFAEQENGDVHKGNLFAWVGAVASFFYNYHLAKFDSKKLVLTEKIKAYGSDLTQVRMKDIDRSEFTTFIVHYKYYGNKSIRVQQSSAQEIVGIDTHFKLVCDKHPIMTPSSSITEHASKKRKFDRVQSGGSDQDEFLTIAQNCATAHAGMAGAYNGQSGTPQVINDNRMLSHPSYTGPHSNLHHQLLSPYFNGNVGQNPNNQQPHVLNPQCQEDFRGRQMNHSAGQQQQRAGNLNAPPRTITVESPRRSDRASCQTQISTRGKVTQQQQKLRNDDASPVASSNAYGDNANCRGEGDGANTTMADATSNDSDDESTGSTKSYYKDLCERLTVELEKRRAADRASKKEIKRLNEHVLELTKEVEQQQKMVSKHVNNVLPTSEVIDEGHI